VPEGQVAHFNASELSRLAGGELLGVEAPEPRTRVHDFPGRLGGDAIEAARAVGKHHLLSFASGRVLHSHLRMSGRWRVLSPGRSVSRRGLWLALHTDAGTAALYRCPSVRLLEAHEPLPGPVAALGPDLLAPAVDPGPVLLGAMRATDPGRAIGDALLDQRLTSGVGNAYKAEALFLAGVSPWSAIGDVDDERLRHLGELCAELLADGVRRRGRIVTRDLPGGRPGRWVYRRAGRPCHRCGATVRSRGQGDANRTSYWCPGCQPAAGARSGTSAAAAGPPRAPR
jgi:endonuclease-8